MNLIVLIIRYVCMYVRLFVYTPNTGQSGTLMVSPPIHSSSPPPHSLPLPHSLSHIHTGSSTGQAPGDDSEVLLKPRAIFPDPFRGGKNILVICDCYKPDMTPIEGNEKDCVCVSSSLSFSPSLLIILHYACTHTYNR